MKNIIIEKKDFGILNVIFCSAIVFLIIRRSWLSDDAFITLRTIDNFVNGYGLTWNIAERVQTYTHPLWMFLIGIFYFFTREPFFTTLLLSILISLCAIIVLYSFFSYKSIGLLTISITLLLSRAFIDYSTSGLENPLSHLIIVIFFIYFIKHENDLNKKNLITLSLISSFGMLNRMDLSLVFAPTLFFILLKERKIINLWYLTIGQAPFIVWEIFSLFYYGYLVPNTAFAKIPIGISKSLIIQQGISYFLHSAVNDPVTIFMIFLPLIIAIAKKDKKLLIMTFSCVLYLLYIVWIGGDFMEGRFFTVPLIMSSIIYLGSLFDDSKIHSFIIVFLVFLGFSIPFNTFTIDETNTDYLPSGIASDGIADERFVYHRDWKLSLLERYRGQFKLRNKWIDKGLDLKDRKVPLFYDYSIGMTGYYAGPNVHIVDAHTLSDPIRSKLPIENPIEWRIGHFTRSMPEGYYESLESNQNLIVDRSLRRYYEKIKIITRDEIFSWQRIKTIFEMNFGKYDYLLDEYIGWSETDQSSGMNFSFCI